MLLYSSLTNEVYFSGKFFSSLINPFTLLKSQLKWYELSQSFEIICWLPSFNNSLYNLDSFTFNEGIVFLFKNKPKSLLG